jgi:hypothetical protein
MGLGVLASAGTGAEEAVWVTLAPYVVAGVSVLGTAIVAILASRQSHAAWLREHRLKAYSTFLDDASLVSVAAQALARAGSDAEVQEAIERVQVARTTLDQAMSTILVLGPQAVAGAAAAYFDAEMLVTEAAALDGSEEEVAKAVDEAMDAVQASHTAFVAAARRPVTRRRSV